MLMIKNYNALINLGLKILNDGVPDDIVVEAQRQNYLFTPHSINSAAKAIALEMLSKPKIDAWILDVPFKLKYNSCLVVMAGNIPMVGFFDMMCCLILGVECYIKPSSKDRVLMEWCVSQLKNLGAEGLNIWDGVVKPQSVIATGSNNASRYFSQQFEGIDKVLRGNRTSVAVITGEETDDDIDGLWHDIFDYYGLGCRSVSHLFIPENYDINSLIDKLSTKRVEDIHYNNAYLQAKALHILNNEQFIDGMFFLARSDSSLTPPMAEITYSLFDKSIIEDNIESIQVVIGLDYTPFGYSQRPTLNDWADGIDLFKFFIQ